MNFKCMVFDLDDTIVNSNRFVQDGLSFALAPFLINVTEELIHELRGKSRNNLFSHLLRENEALLAHERLVSFDRLHAKDIPVCRGIIQLIDALQAASVSTALWTGRSRQSTTQILKELQLSSLFKYVVTSDDTSAPKPNSEGLFLIGKQMGIAPKEIIMIGDHPDDIEAAHRAGATSILVRWYQDNLYCCQPDYHFKDAQQLIEKFNSQLIKQRKGNL